MGFSRQEYWNGPPCPPPGDPLNLGIEQRSSPLQEDSLPLEPQEPILKEISPEYSLEGLMLKLKLQYFGHLIQRADSLEKMLMLGKTRAGGKGGYRQ